MTTFDVSSCKSCTRWLALLAAWGCSSNQATEGSGTTTPEPPLPTASQSVAPTSSTTAPTSSGPQLGPCGDGASTPNLDAPVQVVVGVPPLDDFGGDFSILEGPVWLGDSLLFSQIATDAQPNPSRILRLGAADEVQVFLPEAGSNGLALDTQGRLLVARHSDGALARLSLSAEASAPEVLVAGYEGNPFNSPNDVVVRTDGNLYFTDPDYQRPPERSSMPTRVYRLDPAGQLTVVDETLQSPNGITLSADEAWLYISQRGPLMRYPVASDGSVGNAEPVPVSPEIQGGDGMSLDCAGNVYLTSGREVVVLDIADPAQPSVLGRLAFSGVQQVTNIAFGGPQRSTLYVTSLGAQPRLFKVELGISGQPY